MNGLQRPTVEGTGYDRAACQVGVVHVGYGAFHRAHQAVYFDDYMEKTGDLNWGIAAVNLRAAESDSFREIAGNPGSYILKAMAPDGQTQYRFVRPHLEFADWSTDQEAAEELLNRPTVHAMTITVTESGYYLDDEASLNAADPIIAEEIAGGSPRSIYAFLARALDRRANGLGAPISILNCDNVRANGHTLERNFFSYLALTNREKLADWVRDNVTFPCSMVDRITPRATDSLAHEMESLFPGRKLFPIHTEAFFQWVLEDKFAGPMPDLSKAGVDIVTDVDPYEEAKIRILNGGHSAVTYLGALAGHRTFDTVMRDPPLRAHFDGWEDEEVLPGLTIDLPIDKKAYRNEIAARFSNAAIADTLDRICMDGFSKMPLFIRPTIESCLKQGISPRFGYASIASWYVYARRFADGSMPIAYNEPNWTFLEPLLHDGQEEAFARLPQLWAELPDTFDEFVPSLLAAIKDMKIKWPA